VNPRFLIDDPGEARRVRLSEEESRHALKVLRLRPGDALTLFDGTNREHRGRLAEVDGKRAVVAIEETLVVDREPPVAVTVAAAVPKGRRLEDLVRACAELGAFEVIPLWTRRTVVRERPERGGRSERLRRTSVEASKQCGRNRLTRIGEPRDLATLLEDAEAHEVALISSTEGGAAPLRAALPAEPPASVLLVVGPEGGFAPEEVEAARAAGLRPVTLGRSVLRVATAAVAGLAAVLARYA
jgi:16S rRNA (uracil1498-N3)-methyltransferase